MEQPACFTDMTGVSPVVNGQIKLNPLEVKGLYL